MLNTQLQCDLQVDAPVSPSHPSHLSAILGMARVKHLTYVLADAEPCLGVFDSAGLADASLALLRPFEGGPPQAKGQPKTPRPILSTLAALPPLPGCPFGALLALGNGYMVTGKTGVLAALDPQGGLSGRIAYNDCSALFAPLKARLGDLNIEGLFYSGGEVRLLQRGKKGDARNACATYDWNQLAPWLAGQKPVPPAPKSIQLIPLGDIDGVPLGFTDGAALSGGAWVFTAVAEQPDGPGQASACAGSVVGVVGPDGSVRQVQQLAGTPRVEGIVAREEGADVVVTLAIDPGDPSRAAQVLQARLKPV